MAGLSLETVVKRFDNTDVLKGVDIQVADREFVVFVGPSGCGKSTLLRLIAGLEDVTDGRVVIGDTDVTWLEPADRGVSMVFQSYALYPHMSVRQNMGFGLKMAGMAKAEIEQRVQEAARILQITDLLDRKPRQLSGGQRQRVAIGRSIVRNPSIFLFDEPLSNLDAALRVQMRGELARLHDELQTTMIYVTHDQSEAMTMADRIVVLNAGEVEQVGTPLELYSSPASRFVAEFIGSPKMNMLAAKVAAADSTGVRVALGDGTEIAAPFDGGGLTQAAPLSLGVRPEHILLGDAEAQLKAKVTLVEHMGSETHVQLALPSGEEVTTRVAGISTLSRGTEVGVALQNQSLYLFDQTGRALKRTEAFVARTAVGAEDAGAKLQA